MRMAEGYIEDGQSHCNICPFYILGVESFRSPSAHQHLCFTTKMMRIRLVLQFPMPDGAVGIAAVRSHKRDVQYYVPAAD